MNEAGTKGSRERVVGYKALEVTWSGGREGHRCVEPCMLLYGH